MQRRDLLYRISKGIVMSIKYKRLLLFWVGAGLILTAFLYVIQESYNTKYKFVPNYISKNRNDSFKTLKDKRSTYYELFGALTIGGGLIILGLGMKADNK